MEDARISSGQMPSVLNLKAQDSNPNFEKRESGGFTQLLHNAIGGSEKTKANDSRAQKVKPHTRQAINETSKKNQAIRAGKAAPTVNRRSPEVMSRRETISQISDDLKQIAKAFGLPDDAFSQEDFTQYDDQKLREVAAVLQSVVGALNGQPQQNNAAPVNFESVLEGVMEEAKTSAPAAELLKKILSPLSGKIVPEVPLNKQADAALNQAASSEATVPMNADSQPEQTADKSAVMQAEQPTVANDTNSEVATDSKAVKAENNADQTKSVENQPKVIAVDGAENQESKAIVNAEDKSETKVPINNTVIQKEDINSNNKQTASSDKISSNEVNPTQATASETDAIPVEVKDEKKSQPINTEKKTLDVSEKDASGKVEKRVEAKNEDKVVNKEVSKADDKKAALAETDKPQISEKEKLAETDQKKQSDIANLSVDKDAKVKIKETENSEKTASGIVQDKNRTENVFEKTLSQAEKVETQVSKQGADSSDKLEVIVVEKKGDREEIIINTTIEAEKTEDTGKKEESKKVETVKTAVPEKQVELSSGKEAQARQDLPVVETQPKAENNSETQYNEKAADVLTQILKTAGVTEDQALQAAQVSNVEELRQKIGKWLESKDVKSLAEFLQALPVSNSLAELPTKAPLPLETLNFFPELKTTDSLWEMFRAKVENPEQGAKEVLSFSRTLIETMRPESGLQATNISSPNSTVAGLEKFSAETMPRADQQAMVERIANITSISIGKRISRMSMELTPPDLGKLQVNMVLRNGLLHASMKAETQAAHFILQANIDQLKDALAQQGINVANIDLSYQEDRSRQPLQDAWQGFQQRSQEDRRGNQSGQSAFMTNEPPVVEMTPSTKSVIAAGSLNLVI